MHLCIVYRYVRFNCRSIDSVLIQICVQVLYPSERARKISITCVLYLKEDKDENLNI